MRTASHAGFTLFELIVVLVIVGLILTQVTLSLPTSDTQQRARREAQRLVALLGLAREDAIVRDLMMGFAAEQRKYRFYGLSEDGWSRVQGDGVFRERRVPDDLGVELTVGAAGEEHDGGDEEEDGPRVLFYPSGEQSGFELRVTGAADGERVEQLIRGWPDGRLELLDEAARP